MPRKTRVPQTGEEVQLRLDIEPPYTNEHGTVPKPFTLRCQGITNKGEQCRAVATFGFDLCAQHGDNLSDVELVAVHPDHSALLGSAKQYINRFEFAVVAKEWRHEELSTVAKRQIDLEYTRSKRLLLNLIAELCNIISRDYKP
jgi:hypothetical protein